MKTQTLCILPLNTRTPPICLPQKVSNALVILILFRFQWDYFLSHQWSKYMYTRDVGLSQWQNISIQICHHDSHWPTVISLADQYCSWCHLLSLEHNDCLRGLSVFQNNSLPYFEKSHCPSWMGDRIIFKTSLQIMTQKK